MSETGDILWSRHNASECLLVIEENTTGDPKFLWVTRDKGIVLSKLVETSSAYEVVAHLDLQIVADTILEAIKDV